MFWGPVLTPRVTLPGPCGRADPRARDASLNGSPASLTVLSLGSHSVRQTGLQGGGLTREGELWRLGWAGRCSSEKI